LCALVEGLFEEFTGEFDFARLAFVGWSQFPHGGGEYYILQRWVTAKLAEHPEIPSGGSVKPIVGNAVDVDDPGKLSAILISVKKLSLGGRETANTDGYLPVGQETRNLIQDICITV